MGAAVQRPMHGTEGLVVKRASAAGSACLPPLQAFLTLQDEAEQARTERARAEAQLAATQHQMRRLEVGLF